MRVQHLLIVELNEKVFSRCVDAQYPFPDKRIRINLAALLQTLSRSRFDDMSHQHRL